MILKILDDENINLHQIIKDSGFLADEILSPYGKEGDNPTSNPGSTRNPRQPTRQPEYDTEPTRQQPPKQKIPEFDQEPRQPQRQRQPAKQSSGDGGVTVVSARTPSTGKLFVFLLLFNRCLFDMLCYQKNITF